jgi:hypothetical protein
MVMKFSRVKTIAAKINSPIYNPPAANNHFDILFFDLLNIALVTIRIMGAKIIVNIMI